MLNRVWLIASLCVSVSMSLCISHAQQTNTIYKNVITNLSSKPYVSGPLPNIGQSQHYLYVSFSSAPGHSCAVTGFAQGSLLVFMEGSYINDNLFYFPLTANAITETQFLAGGSTNGFMYATGLAPFIRVRVQNFDSTNCRLTINYAGSLYPAAVDKTEISYAAGGMYRTSIDSNNNVGNLLFIPADPNLIRNISLYSFVCSTQGAQILSLAPGGFINQSFYMAANSTIVIPVGNLPWYTMGGFVVPSDLSLNYTQATHTSCTATWRYE